jgi:Spy/CpxP family protein refolding chaperone
MRRASLVALLCGIVQVWPVAAQNPWWRQPVVQRKLSLTSRQVSSIEAIHARTLEERQALRRSLDRADRAVAAALADSSATDVHVLQLVDEAEVLRKRRNVARAMLLVRISRILTADQRQRLSRLGLRPVVG